MEARTLAVSGVNATLLQKRGAALWRERSKSFTRTGEYVDRSLHPLPDIAFVDWHMTVGSGAEFLSWCRKSVDFVDLSVVVLSGSGSNRELDEARRLGANVVVEKSLSLQELAGHLSEICHSVRAH